MSTAVVVGAAITAYLLVAWRLAPWFTRVAHRQHMETFDAIVCALMWPIVFVAVSLTHTSRWLGRVVEARAYEDDVE